MSNKIHYSKRAPARAKRSLYRSLMRSVCMLAAVVVAMVLLGGLGMILLQVSGEARALFHFIARYRLYAYGIHLALTICLWLGWEKILALLVARRLLSEYASQVLRERKSKWFLPVLTLQVILLASAIGQPA